MVETQKEKAKYEEDESSDFTIYPNNDYSAYFKGMEFLLTKKYKKQFIKDFNSLKSDDLKEFVKEVTSNPENLYVTIMSNKDESNFYTYKQMQKKLCVKKK